MNTVFEAISEEIDIEDNGCLLLDASCYFPFRNQEILNFDATIVKDYKDFSYFTDKKFNHRYPNDGYVTLSKKYGRRVSKLGYAIVEPLNILNQYHFLVFKVGVKSQSILFVVPVTIKLAQKKPFGCIRVRSSIKNNLDEIWFNIRLAVEADCGRYSYKSYKSSNCDMEGDVLVPAAADFIEHTLCYEDKIIVTGLPLNTSKTVIR